MSEPSSVKPTVSLAELFIWGAVALLLWVSSLTCLAPLFICLALSLKLRNKFFSWLLTTFLVNLFPVFSVMKKKLFETLEEQLPAKDSSKTLRFLEIGVGGGSNFAYYPENCTLTLLDANPEFDGHMRNKLKAFPNLKVDRTICGMAEDMKELSDDSYDAVVCTHLLCSVMDADAVLKEVYRVLKPGGKLAFLEHVAFPTDYFAYWIQWCVSPLWKVYMNGCGLDHQSEKIVEKHFSEVAYKLSYPNSLPLFFRPHAIGIATK